MLPIGTDPFCLWPLLMRGIARKVSVFGVFLVRIQFECWKIQIKKIKEDHTCFLKLLESFLNVPKIKKSLYLKNIHNLRKSKSVQNKKLKWIDKWSNCFIEKKMNSRERLLLLICIQKYMGETGSFKTTKAPKFYMEYCLLEDE